MTRSFEKKNEEVLGRIWNRTSHALSIVKKLKNLKIESRKRSAFLLAPLAGVLASGISLYESFKVDAHVKKLQGRFDKFTREEMAFDKEVATIVAEVSDSLDEVMVALNCDVRKLTAQIFTSLRLAEFESFISDLMDPVNHGKLEGPPSLRIMTNNMLEKVSNSSNLRGTIYHANPELLSMGRVIVVDALRREGGFVAHLIMALPDMNADSIWPIYRTHNVMFLANTSSTDGDCGKAVVPSFVTNKKGRWVGVDTAECSEYGQLQLCRTLGESKAPCLNEADFGNCQIRGTKCETDFEELSSGILVNSLGPVQIAKEGSELRIVGKEIYYGYSNFTTIVFDSQVVTSLAEAQTELFWDPPARVDLDDMIYNKITGNPDTGKIRDLVLRREKQAGEWLPSSFPKLSEICGLASLALWIAYLLAWLVPKRWIDKVKQQFAKLRRGGKHQATEDTPDPASSVQAKPSISGPETTVKLTRPPVQDIEPGLKPAVKRAPKCNPSAPAPPAQFQDKQVIPRRHSTHHPLALANSVSNCNNALYQARSLDRRERRRTPPSNIKDTKI